MQPFYAAAICNIFVRAQAAAFGAAGYQILIKIQKPINAPRQETKGGEILALSEKINLHAACSMQHKRMPLKRSIKNISHAYYSMHFFD